ncbi:hypothetical protein [Rubritalea marina]|uniref:hypothetical protein n=1 Tax=Rubritalea marina TaxID=361055 RepID=UPI00037BEDA2|nr:hypothetical protein [Rubritalea marina]
MNSTLVIVFAETRAIELTYDSFRENFLDVVQGDVALCVADNDFEDKSNPLYQDAVAIWESPEYDDWGDGLEAVVDDLHPDWRKLMQIRNQWLGGIKGEGQHSGSGGILIYFREFLKKKLVESGIHEKYDRVIITRSDFMHLSKHVELSCLDEESIYFLNGEHYRGICDRHIICPSDKILRLLSVCDGVFDRHPKDVIEEMSSNKRWNLEQFLKLQYERQGLKKYIQFIPYTMYSVRAKAGRSSWSVGKYDDDLGYFVKYRSEWVKARVASHLNRWVGSNTKQSILLHHVSSFCVDQVFNFKRKCLNPILGVFIS